MELKTIQFGTIEYKDENVLVFEKGLYGFEELQKFLLIKREEDLFFYLNSIEEPEIVFPLIGIRIIDDTYPQEDDYEAFGIVKFNKDPKKITVNLKAPVYISQGKKSGYQTIIEDEKYPVEFPLFKE